MNGGQEVILKRTAEHGTVKLIVLHSTRGGTGFQKIYDTAIRIADSVGIAKGITKEHYDGFIAWVFDNTLPDGLGCFLMNHDPPSDANGKSTSICLGLDFTTDQAKAVSAQTPSGGFLFTPSESNMSGKTKRIYRACRSQRDGTLQNQRCTECVKKASRECRKMDGAKHCTWCIQLGQVCKAPGVASAGGSADGGQRMADGGDDDDEADDDKRKKKSVRRISSKRKSAIEDELADFAADNNAGTEDEEDEPERTSRRMSSYRPMVESDDDNDNSFSNTRTAKILARRTSRKSIGDVEQIFVPAGHGTITGRVGKRPSASSLRRPSATAIPATPTFRNPFAADDAVASGFPRQVQDSSPPRRRSNTKLQAMAKSAWAGRRTGGGGNMDDDEPKPARVEAQAQTAPMANWYGRGRPAPGYKAPENTAHTVTKSMAMSLKPAMRKSVAAPAAKAPAAQEYGTGGIGGDGAGDSLRGGEGADDGELEGSSKSLKFGDDWA